MFNLGKLAHVLAMTTVYKHSVDGGTGPDLEILKGFFSDHTHVHIKVQIEIICAVIKKIVRVLFHTNHLISESFDRDMSLVES